MVDPARKRKLQQMLARARLAAGITEKVEPQETRESANARDIQVFRPVVDVIDALRLAGVQLPDVTGGVSVCGEAAVPMSMRDARLQLRAYKGPYRQLLCLHVALDLHTELHVTGRYAINGPPASLATWDVSLWVPGASDILELRTFQRAPAVQDYLIETILEYEVFPVEGELEPVRVPERTPGPSAYLKRVISI